MGGEGKREEREGEREWRGAVEPGPRSLGSGRQRSLQEDSKDATSLRMKKQRHILGG